MSDNWGADQIPVPRGVRPSGKDILEALSTAQDMPYDALEAAIESPGSIAEPVLAAMNRAVDGQELSDRERNLLFWGLNVLAAVRDARAGAPLLKLLAQGDEESFGLAAEMPTALIPRLVASTFDGDFFALEALIDDPLVDDFVRWCVLYAYAFLVFDGRISRARAHACLVAFDDERASFAGSFIWSGWADAIALLGFDDLVGRRDAAVAEARVLVETDEEDDFAATLKLARDNPNDPARFAAQDIGYLDDPINQIEAALDLDEYLDANLEQELDAPMLNPLRHVGRNDPCPCGSGKKYKKCCLDADAV